MFSCPPLIQAEIEMCEFSPCSGDLDFRCFPTFCSNLERSPRVPIWGTLEPLIEPLRWHNSLSTRSNPKCTEVNRPSVPFNASVFSESRWSKQERKVEELSTFEELVGKTTFPTLFS